MRALLIGAATLAAVLSAPAAAVDKDKPAFSGGFGVTIHSGFGSDHRGDFRRDRRRHRDSDNDVFIGEWPQQGDTLWRSDSFNDWWHERPERAYPRWMLSNQKCEREWYQGNVLRC